MSYMQPCSPVCPCPSCRMLRAEEYRKRVERAALWHEVKAVLAALAACALLAWGCNP